jgi:glycosyltransferase involved in cell wall biosynthesis
MDWQPNIEGVKWLLEAIWPKIHRRFPDLELYLAGRSFPEHLMHTPVPGVIFSGTVPDATAFMEDKAVMLVPLRSGSGMRVKILQGLAAGKTVISTTVGAEGIDAVPGREILLADTPEEFLDRIAYCVDQPAECRAVGKAGRKLTEEKYSDRAISEKLFDFYKQLLEGQLSMRMV